MQLASARLVKSTQAPNESNPLSQLTEVAQDTIFRRINKPLDKENTPETFTNSVSFSLTRTGAAQA